jgi:protein O-GlcNAc transferase
MPETADPSALHTQLAQAHQAWQNQQIEQALRQLEALRQHFPDHPEILHLLGVIHYSQGNAQTAEPLLAQACHSCPDYDDYFFNWGNCCWALQHWEKAGKAFARACSLNPDLTEAWVKQAQCHEQLKNWPAAAQIWSLLLDRYPEAPDLLLSLARNLQQQNQLEAALPLYLRLLKRGQIPAQILQEIGWFFFALRDFEQALQCLTQALPHLPISAESQNGLASVQFQLKHYADALQSIESALELAPDLAEAWWNKAQILLELEETEAACLALRECLAREPGYQSLLMPLAQEQLDRFRDAQAEVILSLQSEFALDSDIDQAHYGAGLAAQRNNQPELALEHFEKALKRQPKEISYHLAQALCLPVIYTDLAHLQSWRERLEDALPTCLERLQTQPQAYQQSLPLQQIPLLFHLAYQGFNDCRIHSLLGDFWQSRLRQDGLLIQAKPSKKVHSPLRVGFVSSFFYAHAVSFIYEPLIRSFSGAPELQVVCFALGSQRDEMSERLKQAVHQFVSLAGLNPLRQAQIVAEAELDVLIYTDIGMETASYLLGLQRLAPMQCVLGGHPVTTGLPEIDWALSTYGSEPADAEHHYREKLHLRHSSLLNQYQAPPLNANGLTKTDLGLPQNRRIYLCPMTLYKIHPEFDSTVAEILERDAQAELCFFEYRQTKLHTHLLSRFEISLGPEALKRVRFLPWVTRSEFCQILSLADLCLDPFHFSAGNTTYLSMHTGTPFLTWPSGFKRGRVATGILRLAGLDAFIADSQADFARRAVEIAHSDSLRAEFQAQVAASIHPETTTIDGYQELITFIKSQTQTNSLP